jgi:hypothetical protein
MKIAAILSFGLAAREVEQINSCKLPLVQARGLPSSLLPSVHPSSLKDSTAGRFDFHMIK